MNYHIEKIQNISIDEPNGLWRIDILSPKTGLLISGLLNYKTNHFVAEKEKELIEASPDFIRLIDMIHRSIKEYPYAWEYSGENIFPFTYSYVILERNGKIAGIDILRKTLDYFDGIYNHKEDFFTREIEELRIDSGGVITRFKLELPKPSPISFFSLNSFSKYPITIESITYIESTETYSPTYEIDIEKTMVETNLDEDIISFQFPEVIAKEIHFVIRQRNYEEVSNDISILGDGQSAVFDSILNKEFDKLNDNQKSLLLRNPLAVDEWIQSKILEMSDKQ